jgi:AcrR family transcriptional regulator
MSRPNDPRALRSREALRQGLLALVEERPFHDITIRDITTRAGLSYPVFFRQYASKEALLADLATEEVRCLLAHSYPLLDQLRPSNSLHEMCVYVQARRTLWKSLLTTGAASAMREEFARISAEIGQTGPRNNPWLPVSLASAFVAAGIFEILAWWLAQPDDYPMQNIETFLERLVARPTARAQDVKLV